MTDTTSMYEVEFQPVGRHVQVQANTSLQIAARLAGIDLASACGAEGKCGQCRVTVLSGLVSAPTPDEQHLLTGQEIKNNHRLACRTLVQGDVKVCLPRKSYLFGQRLQVASCPHQAAVDPTVGVYGLHTAAPGLEDLRSDVQRVMDGLRDDHGLYVTRIDPEVVCQVSNLARQNDWQISVFVRDDEIAGVAPQNRHPAGVAVDLGTTKIAAYLLDLETGDELAAAGVLNPQIGHGEDVISRLNFADRHPDGGQVLADQVRQALNDLILELVETAGVCVEQVADCCIVGNTAMTHLLLELPVRQLARAPYVPAICQALDVKARHLGLNTAPGACVHILPGIGGFVGADHVAMILACDLDRVDRVTLGIDVGTNTEIALARPDTQHLTCVSCASGPAFEGAHIINGMRAASGAIEAVRLTDSGAEWKTIDGSRPVGLCGSGIVDTIAELRRLGLINRHGRLDGNSPRIRTGRQGREFVLVPAGQSGTGLDVTVSQEDVNQIQLAKGAIRAGLEVLLQATLTDVNDVGEIQIAGAFGCYLNTTNVVEMGLFPRCPQATLRQVGNAAGVGAKRALISRSERERARRIAARSDYLELTTSPGFKRHFALGMLFPENEGSTRDDHKYTST